MTRTLRAGEFYGSRISETHAGAVVSIVTHESQRLLPYHVHELPFLCLLLDGGYAEEAAGAEVRYEPLTLVYHPAKLAHADRVHAGSRLFTVEFCERWHGLLESFGPPGRSLYAHSGAEPLWIVLRLYELLRNRLLGALSAEALVYELIGTFERLEPAEAPTLEWLRRVRDHLDQEYASAKDIAGVARRFGVHPVHLSRAFRKAFKTTVGDYIHRRRIQQACRLLVDSGAPVVLLAAELGYSDQSHFNRVFKAITGKTPSRYRAAASGRFAERSYSM